MAKAMKAADFEKMFTAALTDKKFQKDLQKRGFKALDERGFAHGVPTNVQKTLEAPLLARTTTGVTARSRCGVCGVCGICTLCGELNAGSGSAALWALFALGGSLTASTSPRP
jgi:hypothetical protein